MAIAGELESESAVYKTLLESTKAIPWRIDWTTRQFTYIGPQIEELLGWKRDSWLSANDWAERIHPEDRERVVNFCISQSESGCDHEATYRALTAAGGYVWIRDVVHVVRTGDNVDALIGFMLRIDEDGAIHDAREVQTQSRASQPFSLAPAASVEPRDPLLGQLVQGRYRIERRIGRGGMGVVYLAEHVLLRRKVALKTLNERAFASSEMVARFQREAMAAAAIGNEHIVDVMDMGQLADGSNFVVLEYLDGVELTTAVERDGPFSLSRAVNVVLQLCDALAAVHASGIIHRDLKPQNLFLVERDGERDFVKVLDFGICKFMERVGEEPLTQTGEAIGTPQYMAPEQIENPAIVDARTDIYAVGAVLYYLLTGSALFDDSTWPRLLVRICLERPPPLSTRRSDLPPELGAVVARALERNQNDRYPSAAELRRALEPFASS